MCKTFRLMFVRHAETDWNSQGIVQGHVDQPLNASGRLQAATLGKKIASENFTHTISSDLARAKLTCEIALSQRSVQGGNDSPEIELDERLREKSYGCMEGRPRFELIAAAKKAGIAANVFVPTAGETNENLHKRAHSFFLDLCERIHNLNGDDISGSTVLVVTHGAWMRSCFIMLHEEFGCQFENSNLSRRISNTGRCCFDVTLPQSARRESDAVMFGAMDRDDANWSKCIIVKCTEFDVT